jgi:acyl-CoA thioester hydrolase
MNDFSAMKNNPLLLDRNSYRHSVDITPRFSDLTTAQHLNNVRLVEFYQEARISFDARLKREQDGESLINTRVLVAHLSIDYLREVSYQHSITMRAGVQRIGTTSYQLAIALISNNQCAGLARMVLVNMDGSDPSAITGEWRKLLSSYLLPP